MAKYLTVKQVENLVRSRLGTDHKVVKLGRGNFQQWILLETDSHSSETIITKNSAEDLLKALGIKDPRKIHRI